MEKHAEEIPPDEDNIAQNDPWIQKHVEFAFWKRNKDIVYSCILLGSISIFIVLVSFNKSIRLFFPSPIEYLPFIFLFLCIYFTYIVIQDYLIYRIFRRISIITVIICDNILEKNNYQKYSKDYFYQFFLRLHDFKNVIHKLVHRSSYLFPLGQYSAIQINKDLDLCFTITINLMQKILLGESSTKLEINKIYSLNDFDVFFSEIIEISYNPNSHFYTSKLDIFPLHYKIIEYNNVYQSIIPEGYKQVKLNIDDYYQKQFESDNRIIEMKLTLIKDSIIALLSTFFGIIIGLMFSSFY